MKQSKGWIIRDIRDLFDWEKEGYYKTVRVDNFGAKIILTLKIIERYKLKNILIKLDHI